MVTDYHEVVDPYITVFVALPKVSEEGESDEGALALNERDQIKKGNVAGEAFNVHVFINQSNHIENCWFYLEESHLVLISNIIGETEFRDMSQNLAQYFPLKKTKLTLDRSFDMDKESE